jgi:methionyl-tRNA synthetase
VPFDKDAEVSWDGFVRRYNADLANDFGNLVNRTVSMANRYLVGERPAARTADASPLAAAWGPVPGRVAAAIDGCLLHEALAAIWDFVAEANRLVDSEKPWELHKGSKAGDDAATTRLAGVLGDLIEGCRLIAVVAASFLPATAPRVLDQLGHRYPYGDDGNAGPRLLDELRWGVHGDEVGRLASPEPLFPRLETETAAD